MTSSGLTLTRSLAILEEQTGKPSLKAAIGQVRSDVQDGTALSKAMSRHPNQFPLLMVNMIGAGETGGFLDDALDRIAKMYESDAALRAKIKSALTYPVIVLIFSLLMGTGVIIFIVPIFETMFSQLGGDLPAPTAALVVLSHNAYWVLPLVVVVTVIGLRAYRRSMQRSAAFRLKSDRLKLRIPVFGKLYSKLAIARWARNLRHSAGGRRAGHPGLGHRRWDIGKRHDRRGHGRSPGVGAHRQHHLQADGTARHLSLDGGANAGGRRGNRTNK